MRGAQDTLFLVCDSLRLNALCFAIAYYLVRKAHKEAAAAEKLLESKLQKHRKQHQVRVAVAAGRDPKDFDEDTAMYEVIDRGGCVVRQYVDLSSSKLTSLKFGTRVKGGELTRNKSRQVRLAVEYRLGEWGWATLESSDGQRNVLAEVNSDGKVVVSSRKAPPPAKCIDSDQFADDPLVQAGMALLAKTGLPFWGGGDGDVVDEKNAPDPPPETTVPLAGGRPIHMWEEETFNGPTYCQVSGRFLWGFRCQGLKCTMCNLVIHPAAMSSPVLPPCRHAGSSARSFVSEVSSSLPPLGSS